MKNINVVMDYKVGGAYIGLDRISKSLSSEYKWNFTTEIDPKADLVIYMNNHRHYVKAKEYKIKHIIQRKTGVRSLAVQTPNDLDAVICASKRSYEIVNHPKKILIYNGIDLDHINTIKPKENIDLLIAETRIGVGQRAHLGCEYAINHKRKLTILGNGKGLEEDTYDILRKKYPQHNWVGRVSPDEALAYIKGCNAIIVSNPSHGVANQIIEAHAMNKEVIMLCDGLEIPPKDQLDINITAKKYKELIDEILA